MVAIFPSSIQCLMAAKLIPRSRAASLGFNNRPLTVIDGLVKSYARSPRLYPWSFGGAVSSGNQTAVTTITSFTLRSWEHPTQHPGGPRLLQVAPGPRLDVNESG
jgi:hypothetical protein